MIGTSIFNRLIFVFVALTLSAGTRVFETFWDEPSTRLSQLASDTEKVEMRFYGVSSFLVRDGDTSIMVDGFFSRPEGVFRRKIEPNIDVVREMLRESDVALRLVCSDPVPTKNNLDAVIALHGHYDHALDSPLIASLTGAALFQDDVVAGIKERTAQRFPEECPVEVVKKIPGPKDAKVITSEEYAPLSITLIPTKHSANPASFILETVPKYKKWSFPTRAKNMKQGVSNSLHLGTSKGRILIVATAGKIGSEFQEDEFQADVIFLGIGGVGWKTRGSAQHYWNNTVVASGAKRVIPIHWDKHAPVLDLKNPKLDVQSVDQLNRALRLMQEFAAEDPDIELVSIPTISPFDPFFAINDNRN